MKVAIEIGAEGKTCVGCKFKWSRERCPFYPDNDPIKIKLLPQSGTGLGTKFFDDIPERIPECRIATIKEED
jgi:hypothetical protein